MVPLFTAPGLAALAGVAHGFTTRAGGVSGAPFCARGEGLNLARRPGERDEALRENWRRVAAALGGRDVAVVEQVHGGEVAVVGAGARPDPLAPLGRADALVTAAPGVVLAVRVADCAPVLLAAPGPRPAVAAVHAGWRGAAARVVPAALDALLRLSGAAPEEVRAVIGPHIGPAAFEVGPEVVRALAATGVSAAAFARAGPRGRPHVDLGAVLAAQLAARGVRAVERAGPCTVEDGRVWSHRRDGDAGGRQAGVIALVA
jgi:YfiH family protein